MYNISRLFDPNREAVHAELTEMWMHHNVPFLNKIATKYPSILTASYLVIFSLHLRSNHDWGLSIGSDIDHHSIAPEDRKERGPGWLWSVVFCTELISCVLQMCHIYAIRCLERWTAVIPLLDMLESTPTPTQESSCWRQ